MKFANRYHSPLYRSIRGIVWLAIHGMYRIRTVGSEHIPRTGPVVIGSNHIHNLDPLLVGTAAPRFVHFMAKGELFKYKPFAVLLRYLGAFPVHRGRGDMAAIKHALSVPAHDGCLVVFPEGSRSKDGKLRPGLPGIALIARKSLCPVVPVAVIGPYGLRKKLTVRFGPAFIPTAEDSNDTVLEKLMSRIQVLLDEGPVK